MTALLAKTIFPYERANRHSMAMLVGFAATCLLGCGQQPGAGRQGVSKTMETREFAIEGMTCEGCVSTVTSALKAVPGVQSVEVSLKDKKATVLADTLQTSPKAIEDAVDKAGYKARLLTSKEGQPPSGK
jgi:copper chaperone